MVEAQRDEVDAALEAEPRRFRRYPEYRDSGVEWLGEVPKHWREHKMAYLAKGISGGTPSKENPEFWQGDIPWVSPKDMKCRKILDSIDHVSRKAVDGTTLKLLQPPVVLIVVRGMILEHSFPVAITAVPVTVNQDMKALAPVKALDANYFVYLLEGARDFVLSLVEEAGHGTKKLRSDRWRGIKIPLPPIVEQQRISGWLDRKVSTIDALIAKKERLIELLQEQRAALITRAVTKGLDQNVPMKDSGVEWLGEIPAHWVVKKLKEISSLQTGVTLGKSYDPETVERRPYLRVANVQDGYLDLQDLAEIALPRPTISRHELRRGDVLLTEGGDFDKLGRGHVWEAQVPGCLHQNHIFAIRPKEGTLDSWYLSYVMSGGYGRAYFTATSKQSTNLASTNSTKLNNLPVPLPPHDEQVRLVARLLVEVKRLDAVVLRVSQGIRRVNELRAALITAAVTGKIDVREEVA